MGKDREYRTDRDDRRQTRTTADGARGQNPRPVWDTRLTTAATRPFAVRVANTTRTESLSFGTRGTTIDRTKDRRFRGDPVRELVGTTRDCKSTDPETGLAPGGPEAATCVQDLDAQCVLQFTLIIAAGCALHRSTSRVIHRLECLSFILSTFRKTTKHVLTCDVYF